MPNYLEQIGTSKTPGLRIYLLFISIFNAILVGPIIYYFDQSNYWFYSGVVALILFLTFIPWIIRRIKYYTYLTKPKVSISRAKIEDHSPFEISLNFQRKKRVTIDHIDLILNKMCIIQHDDEPLASTETATPLIKLKITEQTWENKHFVGRATMQIPETENVVLTPEKTNSHKLDCYWQLEVQIFLHGFNRPNIFGYLLR